jgi:FKBP-type peptidyl-prolyl cis-trans isomerase FklB
MVTVFGVMLLASAAFAVEKAELTTQLDKESYAIGMDIGISLMRNNVETDPDVLARAIKDVITGQTTQLTDEEAKKLLSDMQKEMAAKKLEQSKALAEKNKADGTTFLAENSKKEGIKTLPSGLQYKVISEGMGKPPGITDTVTVQYTGRLIDGTEFDSSHKRGQPATFALDGVIKGWTEALQLMNAGSKWEIFIPAELAYGEKGGGPIGPNATLIFDVELISVQAK